MADFVSPYATLPSNPDRDAVKPQPMQDSIMAQGVVNEARIYQILHGEQPSPVPVLICGLLFFAFLWHWLWQQGRQK
ncbi:MAG: hypothetical protein LPD71_14295 [Shewanella sp.]|nr:hypothetical protein [Shewanella sp.]MCF1429525.1 hypothetical protein [Shewanella sp.]MCF1439859.1 hypothetical protein [Shewanella sp.]MCF1457709.1 hypothetical protein [Shewanella sp.]